MNNRMSQTSSTRLKPEPMQASKHSSSLQWKWRILLLLSVSFVTFTLLTNTYKPFTTEATIHSLPITNTNKIKTDDGIVNSIFSPINTLAKDIFGSSQSNIDDVDLEKNVTKRLLNRRKRIRTECDNRYKGVENDLLRLRNNNMYMAYIESQKRVVIDKFNRLAMCLQAKGGSSFWKFVFLHMDSEGGLSIREQKSFSGLSYVNGPVFRSMVDGMDDMGYTIYAFGRNPWERLVSLYRQKVELQPSDSKERGYIKSACLKRSVETFEDMLQCIVETWKKGIPDRHWEPLTTRCDICNIPYTFIGKVEFMNEEASEILHQAGLKGNISQFITESRQQSIREHEANNSSSIIDYRSYYKSIPSSLIIDIRNVYKHDLAILNYPDNPG